jgi:DNA polymerase (family 10)
VISGPVQAVVDTLRPHFGRIKVCGSWRRGDPGIGDIDVVVSGPIGDPDLPAILHDGVSAIPGQDWGTMRRPFKARFPGIPVWVNIDVWQTAPDRFGAGTLYATGSGPFNVVMRRWALYKGMNLKFEGLYRGDENIAGDTEREVFEALGWPYVAPEDRTALDYRYRKAVGIYLEELNSK